MTHLTPDELMEAAEGALPAARRAHVDGCARCRHEIAGLSTLLAEAQSVSVPEPSPLYWERLSDRVRTAIAAEPAAPPRVLRWFQWPVLVPLGGLALLLLSLTAAVPRGAEGVMRAGLTAGAADTPRAAAADLEDTPHWALVEALVGDLDVEQAQEAGIWTPPGSADRAIATLSAAEREELLRLLREELDVSGG